MKNEKINIALAGFGNIGSYFYMMFVTNNKAYANYAKLLRTINLDDKSVDLKKITDGSSGPLGRGGMKTKIKAARLSLDSGAKTWVVDGNDHYVLINILEGQNIGTLFKGERDKLQSRKKWIASLGAPAGKLIIDDGAAEAIGKEGGSLLPVGVTKIEGEFEKGSLVTCLDENNEEVARGFSNFNSSEIKLILRLKSEKVLDTMANKRVIHANKASRTKSRLNKKIKSL